MDGTQLKSYSKRELEDHGHDSQLKRQRPNSPTEMKPKKIIDLNDDCLEKIFNRLDLVSLFNVAVASEWVRPAARIVYKRYFDRKKVYLDGSGVSTSGPIKEADRILFKGLKMCLQFVRCFGSSISKLHVHYGKLESGRCAYITQYINNYCDDNLTYYTFSNKRGAFDDDHFVKPFANVVWVVAINCDLGKQFSSFPQWFPKLQTLKFINVQINHGSNAVFPFDHLKSLFLIINASGLQNAFSVKDAKHLLHLCPQLRTLDFRLLISRLKIPQLLDMIKTNPMLTRLSVLMDLYNSRVTQADIERFAAEHATVKEVDFPEYIFTSHLANTLIRCLTSLKKFRFQVPNVPEYHRLISELQGLWETSLFTDFHDRHIVMLHR